MATRNHISTPVQLLAAVVVVAPGAGTTSLKAPAHASRLATSSSSQDQATWNTSESLACTDRHKLAAERLAGLEARHAAGEHFYIFTGRVVETAEGPRGVERCMFCRAVRLQPAQYERAA